MEDVQEARQARKNGPIRLITNRKDTSYNSIRSRMRLQNAEKRKSDIRNLVSSIRLGLDYDVYKAKAMALLNSKARIILFIMIDLAVDALFCVLYLVEAQYLVNKDWSDYPQPYWLFIRRPRPIWVIAVAMSSWNVMSALIRFNFADSKWRFIFSIQTLLDAVTALPFLLSAAFTPQGQWIYVPYFLRSWSVISRLQRALSIGVDIGISDQPFDPVKAKLIGLVAYFVTILYNGMAAFLYCETMFAPKTDTPHTVWDAFYFILITASTVGYGDITPKSLEAKVVVMIFIIVALSVVPGLIAGTIETLKSSRSGGGSYIQSRGANGVVKQYLVMIGDFQSAKRVADILSGFFNKEFSDSEVRIVFLSRNKPSKDVKTLLDMPMHKNRTTMLVGNGLDEVDLKRCQARDASGVFVIPDRVTSDAESQDTMTTLLAWSLHLHAPDTRIFTYNLLPETETFQWGIVEQSMCISDVKQLLLAYNCRHRGTATLILNLLHPSEPANSYDDGWQAQYGDGTGNELYVCSVPEVFIGWTFAQVSWFVFQEFQSILIGVDIFLRPGTTGSSGDGPHFVDASNLQRAKSSVRGMLNHDAARKCPSGQYHLSLNPGNSYRLGKFDQLVFIAQSPDDLEAIVSFKSDQYERLLKDEKGHLEGSRSDFSEAMETYHRLWNFRSEARAAARMKAEHREGRRARHAEKNMKTSQHVGENSVSSERRYSPAPEETKRSSASSSVAGSVMMGKRQDNRAPKKARPAWNVALYDDDDDDDSLSDSSSLRRIKSAQSAQSRQTGFSLNSRDSKNSRTRLGKFRQRSSEDLDIKEKDMLMGALDRPESSQPRQEHIPLSDPRFWAQTGGSRNQGGLAGPYPTASSALDNAGVYPSNFDRNAAAAAAAAAAATANASKQRHGATQTDNSSLGLDKSVALVEQLAISTQGPIPKTDATESSDAIKENRDTHDPLQSLQLPGTSSTHGSLRGNSAQASLQPLDETTYIGQTSITRSETKDLPLCHLLISPPDSVKPLIRDDLSSFKNHIVVCANVGENLYRFLSTLRLAQIARDDLKTIVVLTANPCETLATDNGIMDEMEEHESDENSDWARAEERGCAGGTWSAILSFPRVFWVAGNCRHQRDLVRAGILGASSIVVMSHSVNGLDRDEFADSTAIMAHHMVYQTLQQRNLLGRQHIVVEILERSNIRFLVMRDLSMVRAYHGLNRQKNFLKGKGSSGLSVGPSGFWMTPIFASGQVLVTSLLDNVLFQAYSKTHILDLVKLCCGVRFKQAIELDQILGIDCSNVCLIETPPQFVGKSFLNLFQALSLKDGIIPLGLYRAPDRELNNALPFVFTNPLPGILLKNTDMVYVLKS
ncbi:potassium channel, sub T, member 2 [Dissophora ornata]|nr:potassium channel, sub T, member 2 [Dissophora ornata]